MQQLPAQLDVEPRKGYRLTLRSYRIHWKPSLHRYRKCRVVAVRLANNDLTICLVYHINHGVAVYI